MLAELLREGVILLVLLLAAAAAIALLRRRLTGPAVPWLSASLVLLTLAAVSGTVWHYHGETLRAFVARLSVDRPWWLLALGVLPVLGYWSHRSLAPLGPGRRVVALLLRGLVVSLLVLALAGLNWLIPSDRLAVLFVIDVSRSIPREQLRRAQRWVDSQLAAKPAEDLAGVVYFAGVPRLEIPPVEYAELRDPEGDVADEATDIAAALRLAQAAFPDGAARRIVLVTDGNETTGDALIAAQASASDQIPIDVFPIRYRYRSEVMVDRVLVAPQAHVGEALRVRVVLRATEPVSGTLRLYARGGGRQFLVGEKPVRLVRVAGTTGDIVHAEDFIFDVTEPQFYEFLAQFEPDDPAADRIAANNTLTSFSYVRGQAKVLLVAREPKEANLLQQVLAAEQFEVRLIRPPELPARHSELYAYDLVVLNDVPLTDVQLDAGGNVISEYAITDAQLTAIERAVHDLGTGLVCIGGPHSFGAGGYNDTPLERALPVTMDVPGLKVVPNGALVCIFHASEMPRGNFWQKVIAKEAIRVLGPRDEIGVIAWRGITSWIHPLQPAGNKRVVLARVDTMVPGDMPDFDPGLRLALRALRQSKAMLKHIIVISDGDPTPPTPQVIQGLRQNKITVTAVAVATHGGTGRGTMRDLARLTGGRFYDVVNPRTLPRIFQKEARVVARSLIYERPTPWQPTVRVLTDPLTGLAPEQLPGITGYVTTTAKESELVEVPIVSRVPLPDQPAPILAHWRYGVGKSVAFTSDAGARWTKLWLNWPGVRQFWGQIFRWATRELRSDNFRITAHHEDGRLRIVADVLDEQKTPVNFANVVARVISPSLKSAEVKLRQVAPGRYEGSLEATEEGSYFIGAVALVPGKGPVQTVSGLTVPYSQEYAFLESNEVILQSVASITGGLLVEPAEAQSARYSAFRHDLPPQIRARPLWPWLLFLAACLFLADVANRKIAFSLEPIRRWRAEYRERRRRELARRDERLERLRRRKQELTAQWEQLKQPPPASVPELEPAESIRPAASTPTTTTAPDIRSPHAETPAGQTQQEELSESYTQRLLAAKRKVWESRGSLRPPSEHPDQQGESKQ